MRSKEKVALIIGSGSGIGRGIALAVAKEAAHIVIVDVNEDDIGRPAVFLASDDTQAKPS